MNSPFRPHVGPAFSGPQETGDELRRQLAEDVKEGK